MPDRSDLMLRLTHMLAGLESAEPLPTRLCQAFVQIVSGESGAIALGFTTSERTLLCATSEAAARFEDAQDMVREGPSLDAFRTGEVVVSRSLDDQLRRWPGLGALVTDLPRDVVHAVPMSPGATRMGVLTVHHAPEAAVIPSIAELQFLTDAVGAAIIGDLPERHEESRLWTERDKVSQATGMVIAQLGLVSHDALAVLRAHAYAQEASLVEISRRVVERELDFADGPGGATP